MGRLNSFFKTFTHSLSTDRGIRANYVRDFSSICCRGFTKNGQFYLNSRIESCFTRSTQLSALILRNSVAVVGYRRLACRRKEVFSFATAIAQSSPEQNVPHYSGPTRLRHTCVRLLDVTRAVSKRKVHLPHDGSFRGASAVVRQMTNE
jgi:hypothetical protein